MTIKAMTIVGSVNDLTIQIDYNTITFIIDGRSSGEIILSDFLHNLNYLAQNSNNLITSKRKLTKQIAEIGQEQPIP